MISNGTIFYSKLQNSIFDSQKREIRVATATACGFVRVVLDSANCDMANSDKWADRQEDGRQKGHIDACWT